MNQQEFYHPPLSSLTNLITPAILLNLPTLIEKYNRIRSTFPEFVCYYAVKTNPHASVLTSLERTGACFEIGSPPELHALLDIGVTADRIISSNPVKSPNFIQKLFTLASMVSQRTHSRS